jgi:uncharacterized protein involved in exopolysaccharide biosynthesis
MTPDEIEGGEGASLLEFLRDPIGILRRRWRWMLPVCCLGVAASALVYWTTVPWYRAEATVMLARQQVSEQIVAPTVHDDALTQVDAIVGEILASPKITALIDTHGLYADLRDKEILSDIIARVRSNIKIEPAKSITRDARGGTARVYVISFEADQPQVAADVANDLAGSFIGASIRTRHQLHRLATDFLQRELENASRALREQSRTIAEFKQQHRGALPSDLEANLAKLDLLQQQRQSLALQIAEAEARVVALTSGADMAASPDARLEALKTELKLKFGTHTDLHPDVRALKREIASMTAALEEETGQTADTIQTEAAPTRTTLRESAHATVQVLRAQLAETERQLVERDERVEQTPIHAEQLMSMEEKETILRETYFEFLRKLQDAELAASLQQAQQGARATVLNQASPPSHPVNARWKYAALGIVAAFAMGAGVGVLLEMADPVLVTAHQVELAGGIPVIGSVGRIA